jgi:RNA polymerase sigma-70 factor (ECF subfamily)
MRAGMATKQNRKNMQTHPSKAALQDLPDAELVSRISAGDHAALEFMMRRHNQTLYRTARSIIKDDSEAEDIVQESYLLAYRNMSQFRGDASLSTWLTRIVVNEASGRLRKQRRRAEIIELVPGADWNDSVAEGTMNEPGDDNFADQPEQATLRAETRRLIEAQIDALPEILRTVFVLRAVEELSVEETAAALSIPEATVRSRLFRAKSMLREALARKVDHAIESAFSFDGQRCDRIVAAVLARL